MANDIRGNLLGCSCISSEEEQIMRFISQELDKKLREDREKDRKETKMLLLGTGEAGKSTVIKQMQIIHGQDFNDVRKRLEFKYSVRENVISSMMVLLRAMDYLDIPLEKEENKYYAKQILQTDIFGNDRNLCDDDDAVRDLFGKIATLWNDSGLQKVYNERNNFVYEYLNDSACYFLEKTEEIASRYYIPTETCILKVRQSSTGIREYMFSMQQVNFRVVDVGGQKNERRKWIHCFSEVRSIIFVSAISEYDQYNITTNVTTGEQQRVNRLQESLSLFEMILNTTELAEAAMLLFLNKEDIFDQKIASRSMETHFQDFASFRLLSGSAEQDLAVVGKDFILKKFIACARTRTRKHNANKEKQGRAQRSENENLIYPHFTCATDTSTMKFVITAVQHIILNKYMQETHLI